jgi:UDP-2,3-diacylglucosamine pyrophosphatase LpxH
VIDTVSQPDAGFDYLLLSDVHLGSDIIPHIRPWARTSWLLQDAAIDAQLASFLDHHREHVARGRRWCLVLAGDFIDLVGVALAPEQDAVRTPPTREEVQHGLGSAADHVVQKLNAIAARHVTVFRALSRFVAAGHSIVLVRGNHDIELHWRAAQRAFVSAIVQHGPAHEAEACRARISVKPWFFVVEGVLYVEHGHEFDSMCSYGNPLLPTCEIDTRRIRPTPFSVLLRQVARPTVGLSSASYSYAGMGAYVRLLGNLGLRGSLQIAVRYTRACTRLVQASYQRAVDGGRRHVRRTEVLVRRFARASGVSPATLSSLRALYVTPAAQSFNFIIRNLYIDRIFSVALALVFFAAAAAFAVLATRSALYGAAAFALPGLCLGGFACIGRGTNSSPSNVMREAADHIAGLMGTPWVVMGHVHEPVCIATPSGATYVNLGSWGHDDPPDEPASAHHSACTFLTLRREGQGFVGELCAWDMERGAVAFAPTPPAHDGALAH